MADLVSSSEDEDEYSSEEDSLLNDSAYEYSDYSDYSSDDSYVYPWPTSSDDSWASVSSDDCIQKILLKLPTYDPLSSDENDEKSGSPTPSQFSDHGNDSCIEENDREEETKTNELNEITPRIDVILPFFEDFVMPLHPDDMRQLREGYEGGDEEPTVDTKVQNIPQQLHLEEMSPAKTSTEPASTPSPPPSPEQLPSKDIPPQVPEPILTPPASEPETAEEIPQRKDIPKAKPLDLEGTKATPAPLKEKVKPKPKPTPKQPAKVFPKTPQPISSNKLKENEETVMSLSEATKNMKGDSVRKKQNKSQSDGMQKQSKKVRIADASAKGKKTGRKDSKIGKKDKLGRKDSKLGRKDSKIAKKNNQSSKRDSKAKFAGGLSAPSKSAKKKSTSMLPSKKPSTKRKASAKDAATAKGKAAKSRKTKSHVTAKEHSKTVDKEKKPKTRHRDRKTKRRMRLGDIIIVKNRGKGVLRYVGRINKKVMYGVELTWEGAKGDHNGTVDGSTYFKCPDGRGVLVPKSQVQRIRQREKPTLRRKKRNNAELFGEVFGQLFGERIKVARDHYHKAPKKLGPRDIGRVKNWKGGDEEYKESLKSTGYFLEERITKSKSKGGDTPVARKLGPRDVGRADDWTPATYDDVDDQDEFLGEKVRKNTRKSTEDLPKARKLGPRDYGTVKNWKPADYKIKDTGGFLEERSSKRKSTTDQKKQRIRKAGPRDVGRINYNPDKQ